MPSLFVILVVLALTYHPDETIRAYGAGDTTWRLTRLQDAPFVAVTTLRFTARHQIAGQAPCNRYTLTMDAPFPWFSAGPIAATKRACPDLKAEQAYFAALRDAALSKVEDNRLILSDEEDRVLLVFVPND